MQLISVNIGKERAIDNAKKSGKTGIYKLPVSAPVKVYSLGLESDFICDMKNHGGADQAIYVYGLPDYEWWSKELGRDLVPGTFGENLTISGLESARFSIGDRLRLPSVVIEVTAPRIPCSTLAARMGDPVFAKRFRFAERPGLYCRVIQEGYVQAGESVVLEPYRGETVTAIEMFRDVYEPQLSESTLRRYLSAPVALRDRVDKEEQLRKLLSAVE
jgi:MOSC domain-containing protein YiiM